MLAKPTEGQIGDRRRISQYVATAPQVHVGATVADLPDDDGRGDPIAVVDDGGVLLGALQPVVRQLDGGTPVEQAMIPAPGTIRPDLRVEEVVQQLADDGLDHVFVTTASGVLVGLVRAGEVHV